jgi:hypothetical protein
MRPLRAVRPRESRVVDALKLIELLVGIAVLLIGAHYANFLWEMRNVRRGLHSIRDEMNELVAEDYYLHGRVTVIEQHLKLPTPPPPPRRKPERP